jgi:hypothetical protein
MQNLTEQARQRLREIAQQHNVSEDAAYHVLMAVNQGGGTQAQFNHPELGGSGQWMAGGMTMVGDMFNHGLKSLVDSLCSACSRMLSEMSIFKPMPAYSQQSRGGGGFSSQQQQGGGGQFQSQGGGSFQSQGGGSFQSQGGGFGQMNPANQWWPAELGRPASSGGQNNLRYAIFPDKRRLAVEIDGHVTIYDTLDHQIGGVSQQQSGGAPGVAFSSQRGTFTAEQLPVVSGAASDGTAPQGQEPSAGESSTPPTPQPQPEFGHAPEPTPMEEPAPASVDPSAPVAGGDLPQAGVNPSQVEILDTLERLGRLKQQGIITDEEFNAKKADLLSRL